MRYIDGFVIPVPYEMKNMEMPFDGKRMFFGGVELLLDINFQGQS